MKNCLFLLCCIFCLSACIKEDVPECPAQYNVQVFVKDKNYSNEITKIDENLPFRDYVSGIYYILHNIETGEDKYMQYTPIEGDEKEHLLTFSNIPNGNYSLTVWGNLPSTSVISGLTADLHPNGEESTDIYLGSTNLTFTSATQSASVGLERSKGKLQLVCSNFPDSISKIDVRISPISKNLKNDFTYTDTTTVAKSFTLTGITNPTLETYLAPTPSGSTAGLTLAVYGSDGMQPLFTTKTINATIKRNELTTLEVNYNTLDRVWEISILIDGRWTTVYQLSLVNP